MILARARQECMSYQRRLVDATVYIHITCINR